MKLLICTQVVDKNHPILGFFHRWIEEFSKHCEEVQVVCLYEGEHTLPANVHVHSLGKESGENKFKYLFRFYGYIWKLRGHYDNVFVHMNQIYVILGALVWRMLNKKIGLWYAHGKVSNSLKLAERFTDTIFTSTEQGLQINTPKRVIVGQGIDTDHFSFKERSGFEKVLKLITVGRISRSKNIDTLIQACSILKTKNIQFTFTIVGVALTADEREYEKEMRSLTQTLGLSDHITWYGGVTQDRLPALLQNADIFIHDGATQSLDKALLEAVACGCVVISSNPAYVAFSAEYAPQYLFNSKDVDALARITRDVSELDSQKRDLSMESVRRSLSEHHSIGGLISRIISNYSH